MAICPGCARGLSGLGTFCEACNKYVADMLEGPEHRPASTRIPDERLEDVIQEAGRKALELLGFTVYSLSQDRATRQTPGIADTYVVGHGRTTWAEWKREDGVQSVFQLLFEQDVTENGDQYVVWRHENEAIEWAKSVIESAA